MLMRAKRTWRAVEWLRANGWEVAWWAVFAGLIAFGIAVTATLGG